MTPDSTPRTQQSPSALAGTILPAREKHSESVAVLDRPLLTEYPDSRQGFDPHKAIEFNLTSNRQITAINLMEELIGKDAAFVVSFDRYSRVFGESAETKNQVVLFLNSNSKARDPEHAVDGVSTTQQQDFTSSGFQFAEDSKALIVCAALVRKAKDNGLDLSKPACSWQEEQPEGLRKMNPLEINLLEKLRSGVVRIFSGNLEIDEGGNLNGNNQSSRSSSLAWALGSVPSKDSSLTP